MDITLLKEGIEQSSLSRQNREKYEKLLSALKVAKDLDTLLYQVPEDTTDQTSSPVTDKVLQELEQNERVKEIMNEYAAVEETRKAIANVFDSLQSVKQAKEEARDELLEALGIDKSKAIRYKFIAIKYSFYALYWLEFIQKINEGIQKDNTFWRPIAAGAFAQYLSVKDRVDDNEYLYDKDNYNNTPFHYINAFSIEGGPINIPISNEADQEIIDGLNKAISDRNIHGFLSWLENKDVKERLREHYKLLKEAFQKNVLDIIFNAKNPQYMFEAFVRTDLLRTAIKSAHDMNSPFTQLLILAREFDNWELIGTIEYLLHACVAHRHEDNTNSGNFMHHIQICFEFLWREMKEENLEHENFTAERLEALIQHLWSTLV